MKLYSPATVRQIIDKYKFQFRKSLGQNFLIDGNIIRKIIRAAEINGDDFILEIGAGIGTLTRALAEEAAKVVVIEIDRNLLPILNETLAGCNNVDIVQGDAREIDFDSLMFEKTEGHCGQGRKPYKIVANLPYNIATPLIVYALERHFNIAAMVVMVQKEVAARMVASPGRKDYGALTIFVNYYSEPELLIRVPAKVFMPEPEVESMVVRLKPRSEPPAAVADADTFFRVVRASFGQRRKNLANTIAGLMEGLEKNQVIQMLSGLGIDPGRRGETLSFEEFTKIANAVLVNRSVKKAD